MKQLELIDLGTTYSVTYATEDKYEDKEFTDTLLLDLYLKGKGVSKKLRRVVSFSHDPFFFIKFPMLA